MFPTSNREFENKLLTKVYCKNINKVMSKRDSKSRQQWLIAVFGSPDPSLLFLAKTQLQVAVKKAAAEMLTVPSRQPEVWCCFP